MSELYTNPLYTNPAAGSAPSNVKGVTGRGPGMVSGGRAWGPGRGNHTSAPGAGKRGGRRRGQQERAKPGGSGPPRAMPRHLEMRPQSLASPTWQHHAPILLPLPCAAL